MQKVYELQNKEEILIMQFLQRVSYFKAEILNYITWLPVIAGSIYVAMSYILDFGNMPVRIGVALIAAACLKLNSLYSRSIRLGAASKAYIDDKLYGFQVKNDYNGFSIKELVDEAVKVSKKKGKYYQQQISNNGAEGEHGLLDWYSLYEYETDEEIIYGCQSENIWWNTNLSRIYITSIIIASVTSFILILVGGILISMTLCDLCILGVLSVSLFGKLYNEYGEYKAYDNAIKDARRVIKSIERNGQNLELLVELQEEINAVRASGFLVPSYLHKIKAVSLHSILEKEKQLLRQRNE